MYHFSNQSSAHNGYQQFFGVATSEPGTNKQENQSETVLLQSLVNSQPPTVNAPKCETKKGTKRVKANGGAGKEGSPSKKKGALDTSSFTVEQRVMAAAWVHDRYYTHTSIGQIKQQFVKRFGRAAPAKNTLLVWERKLFATGSVKDAPRSGRPASQELAASEVRASLASAPALSVRARAAALRVPRSTLRALLRKDPAPRPKPDPVKQKAPHASPAAPPPGS